MRVAVFAADHLGLILQNLVERREARWLIDSTEAHVSHHRLGKRQQQPVALGPDGCLLGVLFLDYLQIRLGGGSGESEHDAEGISYLLFCCIIIA